MESELSLKNEAEENDSLENEAKSLISEMFDIAPQRLLMQSSLSAELDIDSIDMIDLLSEINKKFDLELELFDFQGCSSLGELLSKLQEKASL